VATGDTNYEGPYYAIVGGMVFVKGVFDGQTATGHIGAVPVAARPAHHQRLRLDYSGGSTLSVDMWPDGVLKTPAGSAPINSFIILTGEYPLT